jgi:hypothetical protein
MDSEIKQMCQQKITTVMLGRGRPSLDLGQVAGPALDRRLRAGRKLDGQPLRRLRRHQRQDVGSAPRVDLRRQFKEHADFESRSKILAASRGFMFSYMVTRPLKRAASASFFLPVATLIPASTALSSARRICRRSPGRASPMVAAGCSPTRSRCHGVSRRWISCCRSDCGGMSGFRCQISGAKDWACSVMRSPASDL